MKTTTLIASSLAASAMLAPLVASAHDAGDWLVRGRLINISPNEDSSLVNVAGAPVAGATVSVDNNWSLDVDITRMMTKNIGFELLLDISSRHDVSSEGTLTGFTGGTSAKFASARVLPPTLFAQYHFMPDNDIQPYAGIGLNYTTFFDADLEPNIVAGLGGASGLELDDSWGIAAQIGADFKINDNWFLNADIKWIDIDTTAKFNSGAGRVSVDVEIDPIVYGVGVGYRFD